MLRFIHRATGEVHAARQADPVNVYPTNRKLYFSHETWEVTLPDGSTKKLTPEEFVAQYVANRPVSDDA
jgi:hypothetical protein